MPQRGANMFVGDITNENAKLKQIVSLVTTAVIVLFAIVLCKWVL